MKVKNIEKSEFVKELEKEKKKNFIESLSEEEKRERNIKSIDGSFERLANKENFYYFYCPDIPFACSLVKVIYEYAKTLTELGYNVMILHEMSGFKPEWLDSKWVKNVKVGYLSEKKKDKITSPVWDFEPSDTIIVPEGFWTVMSSLANLEPLHKVVLATGYNGLATLEIGANWGAIGFRDVICFSKDIEDTYKQLFPQLNYYTIGYEINFEALTPVESEKIKPEVGLMIRDRESAQKIINIFYNKYPNLSFFHFKVLKKLSVSDYYEAIKNCAIVIFIDDKAGCPAPPVECIVSNTPVLTPITKGTVSIPAPAIFIENGDEFYITDMLANFCSAWLESSTKEIREYFYGNKKEIENFLADYKKETVKVNLYKTFTSLQEEKIKVFSAIKNSLEKGTIDSSKLIE